MKVSFISLGCAKNLVNTEQMMALCRDAGHTLQTENAGADVVVINTCGFIDSAKEEAIDTILSVAALKAQGLVGKILVTGCLTQRYQQEILDELPEVDGIMGTGSYGEIVPALEEVVSGGTPRRFGDIHGMIDELDRVLTTPKHFAYLRIAEGCDNRCSFCVIPTLRGKYRSRRMEDVLAEAEKLAAAGVNMKYLVGTMIEIPRAALTADEIAKEAEFFSFGTNDLTQMTFGFSRDDAGKFLPSYYDNKIYESDPFARLDQVGVGKLVKMAAKLGRETRPELHLGICGEHGGDPSSVEFCHKVGLDYVSCSPFRVPIARLAAAQAAIKEM